MGTYYKPQSPIQSGEDFIYPITTADQIMKSDNSRRLEQAGLIVADNSTSLGGVAAKDYARKTDTAPDSSKLGGKSASEYALKTDTAPDSSKLGGKAPEYYIQPRNLLDNSDFRNPVNQRGATSYSGVWVYSIDRWAAWLDASNSATLSIVDGGITPYPGMVIQRIASKYIDSSKTYTLAAMTGDGLLVLSGKITSASQGSTNTNNGIYFDFNADSDAYQFTLLGKTNASKFIWAALYEGTYTAETLPPYVPKGYAAELAECQRYYLPVIDSWSMGVVLTGTGYICLNIPTNIKMRISPTTIISNPRMYHPTYDWVNLTYRGLDWYAPFYRIIFDWPSNIQASISDIVLINGVSGLSADL